MTKFVEKAKMSKKAQRELARSRRALWEVSPVSRKVESKKLYNRKRKPCTRYDDAGAGLFSCLEG